MNRILLVSFAIFALFAGCATPSSRPRIDNLPMYGQPDIPRPEFLKKADEDFISKASAGFGGDRSIASRAWAEQAGRFMSENNLDYAMRRYNQAWLLDDKNYEAYWGFGRVMVETDRFDDGVKFIKRGLSSCVEMMFSFLQSTQIWVSPIRIWRIRCCKTTHPIGALRLPRQMRHSRRVSA